MVVILATDLLVAVAAMATPVIAVALLMPGIVVALAMVAPVVGLAMEPSVVIVLCRRHSNVDARCCYFRRCNGNGAVSSCNGAAPRQRAKLQRVHRRYGNGAT